MDYTTKFLLGYVRKSIVEIDPNDENAPEPASFLRQKNAITRWAQAHGFRVKFYTDMDISGRYERNRPGWQELLRDLDDPQVAGVIVEAFDRDHRNLREFLAFNDDQLAPRGQALISATQNIDLHTTDGRAMASVLMTFAELESRKASDRMRDTIQFHREKEGKYYGPPLFGCDRNPNGVLVPTAKAYWLHPATGLVSANKPADSSDWEQRYYHDSLAAIFQIYGRGNISYAGTAAELNALGWRYLAKSGGQPALFDEQRVRDTIRNHRLYGGELHVGKSRPSQRRIPGAHQPILPIELIEQAAAVFENRAQKAANKRHAHFFLLSGITYCAACGRQLDGHFLKGRRLLRHRYGRGQCVEPVPVADAIEADLVAALVEIPMHPEFYSGFLGKVDQMIAAIFNTDAAERQAQLRLVDLAGKLKRLQELYIDGELDRAAYQARKAVIEADIAREAKRTQIEMPRNLRSVADDVVASLRQINQATPQTQKSLIANLIKRLDITGREISQLIPTDWAAPFFFSLSAGVEGGHNLGTAHPPHLKITEWLK